MAKIKSNHEQEDVKVWIKKCIDDAVLELALDGIYANMLVEAKPAWAAPFQIVIGKIREMDKSKRFRWLICGEVPTDHLDSTAAATPREAARHFAMKWQLDATRLQDASQRKDFANQLVTKAEGLYALVDDASLWPPVKD